MTPDPSKLSALAPTQVGGVPLTGRIAFTATVNNLGHNTEITDRQVAFYAERARGGASMVITEGLSVHPTSIPNGTIPLAYDDRLLPGLRRIADGVHEHGQLVLGQLWHVGRQALWNPTLQPWSPSAERDPYSGATPHGMSVAEIAEVVQGFADTAANLQQAGFDGVELHGAHGYLITQFLSPSSNRRLDQYGGSTAGRTRMLGEVIDAVRERCGKGFLLGVKLSAHEYVEGGLDLAETQHIVELLVASHRPDYLAVSQANFSPSLEYHVPDLSFPDAPFVHLAKGVRDVADEVPVMALAKIPDVETASRLVDEGTADLIGMSRPWLADSQMVTRVRQGATPRPCVYCNVCWDFIHTGRAVSCIYAAETGWEGTEEPMMAEVPIRELRPVHVVGAGLAGLETARVAALGGHVVTVHEARDEAGGRLSWEATIPGRERMGLAAQWLQDAARGAGAELAASDEVDQGRIDRWSQEGAVVVVATGASPVVEDLPGTRTVSLQDAWAARETLAGPVVVVDEVEDEPVYAFCVALAAQGLEVHLVTRREAVGRRVAYVSKIGVLRRLDEAGVRIHALVTPVRVTDGELVARHAFSGRERAVCPAAVVVRAGPYAAEQARSGGLSGDHVIGDASAPRDYVAINQEASRTGRQLGVVGTTGEAT